MLHGQELLQYRVMREHADRLLAEAERARAVRIARAPREPRPARRPLRAALVSVGKRMVAVGRRLEALGASR